MILYQSAFYTHIQPAPTHASAIGSLAKVTLFVKYSQVNMERIPLKWKHQIRDLYYHHPHHQQHNHPDRHHYPDHRLHHHHHTGHPIILTTSQKHLSPFAIYKSFIVYLFCD